jgi:hypothetical protein
MISPSERNSHEDMDAFLKLRSRRLPLHYPPTGKGKVYPAKMKWRKSYLSMALLEISLQSIESYSVAV